MEQLRCVRSRGAALATLLAAASLTGCMDFLDETSTRDETSTHDPSSPGGSGTPAPAGTDPDTSRPPALKLVINEVDYDQAGADDAEFVEIVNPNSDAVDLADYRVELINGSNGRGYGSYAAEGRLESGGYLVIGDPAVIASVPAGTHTAPLKSGGLQNGPDAVRIVETATGRVLDGLHYEEAIPDTGEGTPAPEDITNSPMSIGRCPDGFDSDDNGADFAPMTPTPGAANDCAGLVSGGLISGESVSG